MKKCDLIEALKEVPDNDQVTLRIGGVEHDIGRIYATRGTRVHMFVGEPLSVGNPVYQTPENLPGVIEGRIVHYVPHSEDGFHEGSARHLPAMIVRVWGNGPQPCVNLLVFCDGADLCERPSAEKKTIPTRWITSVMYSADSNITRSWHWIERR